MKKSYEEKFATWEAKKRNKMGDRAFLEKYIKTFPKQEKSIKFWLPIAIIGQLFIMIMSIIEQNYDIVMNIITILICVYCLCYFHFVLFDLHKRKVEEWKKELEDKNFNHKPHEPHEQKIG